MKFDFAIVGGGVMGVSTALAVQRKWPTKKIIIFQGIHTETASKGITKIIRTPYIEPEYSELASEAKRLWETTPPYCNFYRQTGWIQEVPKHEYRPFHRQERKLSMRELEELIHMRDLPRLDDQKELWLNEDIGVADAAAAVEAVVNEAANCGNDVCYGVRRADGSEVFAENTIVAAGAWSPTLLHKSGIALPEGLFTATAVAVATLDLTDEEYSRLRSMPILSTDDGELMPPDPFRKTLQITSTRFNSVSDPNRLEEMMPCKQTQAHRLLIERMMPEMAGRALDYTVYPELNTLGGHPVVDSAPNVRGLYLVTGGAYHCYKFLPVIGEQFVKVMQGERDDCSMKWVWDRA